MRTNDPDRCPAGHDVQRDRQLTVVQCQVGVHHNGPHYFHEDHYTVRWGDEGNSR